MTKTPQPLGPDTRVEDTLADDLSKIDLQRIGVYSTGVGAVTVPDDGESYMVHTIKYYGNGHAEETFAYYRFDEPKEVVFGRHKFVVYAHHEIEVPTWSGFMANGNAPLEKDCTKPVSRRASLARMLGISEDELPEGMEAIEDEMSSQNDEPHRH